MIKKVVSFIIITLMFLPKDIYAQVIPLNFKELADEVKALYYEGELNRDINNQSDVPSIMRINQSDVPSIMRINQSDSHIPSMIRINEPRTHIPSSIEGRTSSERYTEFTVNSCKSLSLLEWLHQDNIQILEKLYKPEAKSEYLLNDPKVNRKQDCKALYMYRYKVNNLLNENS